jgi:hypothetical protein
MAAQKEEEIHSWCHQKHKESGSNFFVVNDGSIGMTAAAAVVGAMVDVRMVILGKLWERGPRLAPNSLFR